MESLKLEAARRTTHGTRACRRLRETGLLPAIIYGHGEPPEMVSLGRHDLEVALAHGARTLEVDLDGKAQRYLIKDVQYDYLDHLPIHVDLTRVELDERVRVNVGIELRGEPKGVHEGGMLDQELADIEVECLVTEIPETLHPIVSDLGIADSLFVKDLELPPGVVAVTDGGERIATVRPPMVAPEPEEAPEAEEEVAEPERIGRVRKEEEEQPGGRS